MELGLKERVCVVTGASRGIGLATARMLCAEGARVLLVARTERDVVEAADECMEAGANAGGAAESLACDVTDPDAAERIAAAAEDLFGPAEVLVNNAGSAKWRDLDDIPDQDWQAAWDVNVMAPMRLMRRLTPGMKERNWGRVVNVASTSAKRPSAAMAEYSVAKAAELSLSRLYADRLAGDGVLVNAVCPGPTKSEMWMADGGLLDQSKEHGGHGDREQALDAAGSKRPIGRLAEVEEIASVIVFLCSEQAGYVAGAAWSVDGGTVQVII
jgi:NAD(P)-dependent dehydrogenase (short-subunit alcohol dehydrogenase family)